MSALDYIAGLCRLDYAVHRRTGRCIARIASRDADGYGLVTSSLRGHAATVRRLSMETLAGATESDVDAWIAEDGAAADGQSTRPPRGRPDRSARGASRPPVDRTGGSTRAAPTSRAPRCAARRDRPGTSTGPTTRRGGLSGMACPRQRSRSRRTSSSVRGSPVGRTPRDADRGRPAGRARRRSWRCSSAARAAPHLAAADVGRGSSRRVS